MVSASANPTRKPLPARKAQRKGLVLQRDCTRQEIRFAELVAQGWPLHRCYTQATGAVVAKKNHAEVQAWKWRLRPAVEAEIIRQRAALTDATAMTRAEKTNLLSTMAREQSTPAAVRVGAIQVHNRMTGDDEPIKLTVSGHVVFVVDPIGDGTRGQKRVVELATDAPADPEPPALAP